MGREQRERGPLFAPILVPVVVSLLNPAQPVGLHLSSDIARNPETGQERLQHPAQVAQLERFARLVGLHHGNGEFRHPLRNPLQSQRRHPIRAENRQERELLVQLDASEIGN